MPTSDKELEENARQQRASTFTTNAGGTVILCYCFGSPCCCTEHGYDDSGVVPDPYERR